jgi:catechol 2,3-dioxygenase-like lactoylglutathione lyase family enzyme
MTSAQHATTLPVADVDRAAAFYRGLGWRIDIDFERTPTTRDLQLTETGSPATATTPGSRQGLFIDVDDIEAARDELIDRGIEVSEIWHIEPGQGRVRGLDPQRRSSFSRASFADPDGNTWILEEITQRLPGRTELHDSGALVRLLFETARRHGAFEAADWWDWYAAYLDAREKGSTPERAAEAVGRRMAAVKHLAVTAAGALAPAAAA